MNLRNLLNERVRNAMTDAGIPADHGAHVAPSKRLGFGDYQANGAMSAAKSLRRAPRDVAQDIVDNLDLEGLANQVEIAGPGFINISLNSDWLATQVQAINHDARLGLELKAQKHKVIVDYSSPNLAKEMHVGHLRSTIIGDAMARILEFIGDEVIRQNHVGDWGTQFGMLIAELEQHMKAGEEAELALKDLEHFYQQAKLHFDADENFANRARDYVVKLQSGDENTLALWKQFRAVSLAHNLEIYKKLNVSLDESHTCGESAYNAALATTVEMLKVAGIAEENEGAIVIFLQELADKNGDPSVVIVQKSDGGFLYATTDLAAIRYRASELEANRILYFIDARQSLHMQQVFTIAAKAGFVDEWVSLEHHAFGTMMGPDGKPFKTRDGGTVKLAQLIDEGIARAGEKVRENSKNLSLNDNELQHIANKVGIGAIKYADLSKTRTHDYIFNWDDMLRFDGNTGPYLQYAYARICSIFRKANIDLSTFSAACELQENEERALALKLAQFSETIEQVATDAMPHTLCSYLYDLASHFMTFYEACPILKEGVSQNTKESRLSLAKAVANTLKVGLDLLGIEVIDRM